MRTTHTLATLEIDHAAWSDIRARIVDLGPDYAHMLLDDEGGLDMTGVMLAPSELRAPTIKVKQKNEGLSPEEERVLELLSDAFNAFIALTPDEYGRHDNQDFRLGISALQRHVMSRPIRREYNNRPA